MAQFKLAGEPGSVWYNDTGKVKYQFICNWTRSCGLCVQLDRAIGDLWPIPIHRSCRCQQLPIYPREDAQPFVDFQAKMTELSRAQQQQVVGGAALRLIEQGKVEWSDVVTGNRIRSLAEVAGRQGFTVADLTAAGITQGQAERAVAGASATAFGHGALRHRSLVAQVTAAAERRQAALRTLQERLRAGMTGPKGTTATTPEGATDPALLKAYLQAAKVKAEIAASLAAKEAARVATVQAEALPEIIFTPSAGARDGRRYQTVLIDVARVEADLARTPSFHVGPRGTGAAIGGRYEEFARFLERARQEGTAIEMPRMTIADATGRVSISDGRHRFAVLRDQGVQVLPVSVPKGMAVEFRRRYGSTRP